MKNPDNFTHIDEKGRAKMVDVSDKKVALRTAKAILFLFQACSMCILNYSGR
ncbi:Cyclic pyranopterin monophosphate synthase [subsurface metagenome]